jgi:hypothetical protein
VTNWGTGTYNSDALGEVCWERRCPSIQAQKLRWRPLSESVAYFLVLFFNREAIAFIGQLISRMLIVRKYLRSWDKLLCLTYCKAIMFAIKASEIRLVSTHYTFMKKCLHHIKYHEKLSTSHKMLWKSVLKIRKKCLVYIPKNHEKVTTSNKKYYEKFNNIFKKILPTKKCLQYTVSFKILWKSVQILKKYLLWDRETQCDLQQKSIFFLNIFLELRRAGCY